MKTLAPEIRPETAADAAAVEALHEFAFGPGRFARTAFRLRERVPYDPHLSLVAMVGPRLAGSIRLSPIRIGATPALLLGPLAVDPDHGRRGLGSALVRLSLAAARERGHELVLLVGDAAYYGRLGFHHVPPTRVRLPGPVDTHRVLIAELVAGAAARAEGLVAPVRSA
ncbi:N-acetyltransferase [Siculibacillus lacustris]|uniref:N-acetyltransferase n=1 Tax=Siculibacillus lacustris TaxID=1549641 RepID=A0A4V2KTI6_9HYPH|nr:N-acetyltransferase [Siculibacillus lacustris]TBW37421.1 N-acetyltransferase [Siculibacillus lacustris]